ncbi:hypothetical protein C8Q77DRAFT_1197483 [Trametes polyzona]|nr:hypothetical protein C8Q77DRAFT_1197483 [Trametes polyzona]
MSLRALNQNERPELLEHATYFRSPINVLIASLEADTSADHTLHDVLDAYATFSLRIKAVSSLLSQAKDYVALRYLKSNVTSLARCIQRDLRRALREPFTSDSHTKGVGTASSTVFPTPGSSSAAVNTIRDIAAICHHALQLLSDIFHFPGLFSLFPQSVLTQLLKDVIVISRHPELPILDDEKTRTLATWSLSILKLPKTVIAASADSLQVLLEGMSASACPAMLCNVVHNLLSRYPETFMSASTKLLPDILSRAASFDASVRMNAATALAGYALGRLSIPPSRLETVSSETSSAVRRFLRSLPQKNSTAPGPSRHPHEIFSDYLTRAAQSDVAASEAQGSRWATTIVCALTVLSGQGIFSGTRMVKLVLETIERINKGKTAIVVDLVASAWKSLVWAFLRLQTDLANVANPSAERHRAKVTAREAAFGIVRQELRGGAGACLVAGLVYQARASHTLPPWPVPDHNIQWALAVLKDMVVYPSKSVFNDALHLLSRITGGVGASAQSPVSAGGSDWNPNDIVVKEVLSRHMLNADAKAFVSALHAANKFDPAVVRPVSETDLIAHWDELAEIWTLAMNRALHMSDAASPVPDVLGSVWQALLLVQTQLTQENGHLTTPPAFTTKAVSIVSGFLEWQPLETANASSLPVYERQRRALSTCRQLWGVMRNVFSEAWLSSAAESLITTVLQHGYDLSNGNVKSAWSELCSALVLACAPALMARLVVEDDEHRLMDIKRELWRVTARQWPSINPYPSVEETVTFLAIPLRNWGMDHEELPAWFSVFDCATERAMSTAANPLEMYDALVRQVSTETAQKRFLEQPELATHLLSRLRLSSLTTSSPSAFLQAVDGFLHSLYCALPERVAAALQLLKQIHRIIEECPPDALVSSLSILSNGLAIWIADEKELLLVEEYNNIVIQIYCDALRVLRDLRFDLEMLTSLAHFLYSAFVRIPEPARGPLAFIDFWTSVQPAFQDMRGSYPEEIKTALYACRHAFGANLPDDFSFDTESYTDSQVEASPVKSEALTPRSARGGIVVTSRRTTSPVVSPKIPYGPSLAYRNPLAVHHVSPSPVRQIGGDAVSSDFLPSSPTDAARVRRMAGRSTSRVAHERAVAPLERPAKRRKASGSPQDSRSAGSGGLRSSPAHTGRSASARTSSSRSTPRATGKSKGKQRATDRSSVSPRKADPVALPSSDDYDAWEAPICDVQELSDEVPDSQPSDAADDDDSLIPGFMKAGRHDAEDDERRYARSDDTTILDEYGLPVVPDLSDEGEYEDEDQDTQPKLGKRPRPRSPTRMHTAPADLQHSHPHPNAGTDSGTRLHSHDGDAPPEAEARKGTLRRARTASARLEELRHVYDALREDGSQLAVDEIAAASALTSRLGAMLSEKLERRLHDGSVASSGRSASEGARSSGGEGRAKRVRREGGDGKGKGKGRE